MRKHFLENLETKLREQLKSQNVGFLLGAGTSHLDGFGYPLANELWDKISAEIEEPYKTQINTQIAKNPGIEQALDELDKDDEASVLRRKQVSEAISKHFMKISPNLDIHRNFIELLTRITTSLPIKVFSLNYDPLIEWAAQEEKVRLFDGFYGNDKAYFEAGSFQHVLRLLRKGNRGLETSKIQGNSISLVKLHGSIGWYQEENDGIIRRIAPEQNRPGNSKLLMIPPQRRKASEVSIEPYSNLWLEFRHALHGGGLQLLNRLFIIGYGMGDSHVNEEIKNALQRENFSVFIITKTLSDKAFNCWSEYKRVHIITESRCSMAGVIGDGHPEFSNFKTLIVRGLQWLN